MKQNMKSGGLYVFSAAIIWSFIGLIVRSVDVGAAWFVLIRSLVAGVALLPFWLSSSRRIHPSVVVAGLAYGVFLLSATAATRYGGAALSVAMQYSAPLYAMLFSFTIQKQFSKQKLPIFLLLLAGVTLNVLGALEVFSDIALYSGAIVGISFFAYSSFAKKMQSDTPLAGACIMNFIAALCSLCVLPFEGGTLPATQAELVAVLVTGLVVSAFSYGLYAVGIQRISVESAVLICLAEPLLNPLWVWLVRQEVPNNYTLWGLVFILIGAAGEQLRNILKARADRNSF